MRRRGKSGAAEKHDANQPHAPRWTRCFYLAILHLAVDQPRAFIFCPNRQRALAYELSVPLWPGRRDDWCMAERRRTSKESQSRSAEKYSQRGVFPDDLHDYALPEIASTASVQPYGRCPAIFPSRAYWSTRASTSSKKPPSRRTTTR